MAGKITVLNPLGSPPKVTSKALAPRLVKLDGKTVYLVDVRFDNSGVFMEQLQHWFSEHMPEVK
ncbi:MAG: UGSC family (seleno)protein, partial [bacterium]